MQEQEVQRQVEQLRAQVARQELGPAGRPPEERARMVLLLRELQILRELSRIQARQAAMAPVLLPGPTGYRGFLTTLRVGLKRGVGKVLASFWTVIGILKSFGACRKASS